MKFFIIIPAHNEEKNMLPCLESLKNQTFQDFKCVIVNDGSTDKTQEIAEKFINNVTLSGVEASSFKVLNLEKSEHQPGAKVVRTFNKGLETENLEEYDVVCKFDADIIFSADYLEKVNEVYEKNPKAGMVSGLVYIEKNGEWVFENLSSKNHVRGPIKSYRKELFLKMKGLRAVLGWDNIDVMLCKMHGFETVTIQELCVKHLRPTAYKYKSQKAQKLGEYFYNIGLNFPLAVISSAKSSWKNKSVSEFFITMKSFLNQKNPRVLSQEEIAFIRNLRWNEMFKKIMKS
ncbi:glycosyltransferase family 2 protein [Cloacibacterium sp. TD35]|uniref:glycosyltransferase family 2 protein n=1 Tax=Cloacibacterium sp. TD35 TaxID=2976818 RepID=UPI00237E3B42|nr:glycosyltransferase family A protein [Cloacibacterium sp. TD35]WDT67050.1 glycosyltransferase family 2 protein [Cloacibacterium sp. TD35]